MAKPSGKVTLEILVKEFDEIISDEDRERAHIAAVVREAHRLGLVRV